MSRILDALRRRRAAASITAAAVFIAAPITVAVLHDGFPLSDVDLHARDVWVTNESRALAGRLNTQITELDGGVAASTKNFDVLQDGGDVFLPNDDDGSIQRVDPAYTTLEQKVDAPPGSQISYGGGRIAILRPSDGALWLVDATAALQFDPASAPAARLGKGAVAAVGLDGTVAAVSLTRHALYEAASGTASLARKAAFSGSDPEVTVVGSRGVALDGASRRIVFDDGSVVRLSDHPLRLQQPGPARDWVVVATGDSLMQVTSGGTVTRHSAKISQPSTRSDEVAAPVVLGTCLHGAWSDAARYLGVCTGRPDSAQDVQVSAGADLRFRVNRDVIALNNVIDGGVWLVRQAQLVHVDADWDQATPPSDDNSNSSDQTTSVPNFEQALADRSDENHPPIARPDSLGARSGRTAILDVLANDSDPDGDVLTISKVTGIPAAAGTLEPIEGGRALQFAPAAGFTGTVSFHYTVIDGRPGGVAEAQVDVAVRATSDGDFAPVSSGTSAVTLEAGKTISYNVLGDWYDPDGDDLILTAASAPGALVRFSPDGLITYTQLGSELGSKTVAITVSDGQKTTDGQFIVDVKAPGAALPIGTPDFASTFVGTATEISPLQNDLSPSGAPLTLGQVTAITPGITPTVDPDRGTVSVTAGVPGQYYLQYVLAAGPESSKGLIRVDVDAAPKDRPGPTAVKDVAYLRPNQPLTLPVLDNDVSPSGAVLGIQSVSLPDDASQLTVQVLSSAKVTITAPSGMTQPIEFSYTISDGFSTSTAGVSVVPIPDPSHHQAPIAVDDQAKVRVGDIASVPVLANDFHPDGAQILLDPELVEANVGDGLAFITGDQVRLQAPTKPGQYTVTYRDYDAFDESATARVTFTVLAKDAKNNAAPHPVPIVTRVFQGATLKVTVPLDGIDPDGDSVSLVSVSGNSLGEILDQTSTSFSYQAYGDKAGTDEFSYEVHDAFGAAATGEVRIGVIPRPSTVLPPDAVDDQIQMRPGRVSSVPVLADDSDPNGYPITLRAKLLEVQTGLSARVDTASGQVVVTASKTSGTYAVRYQIDNGHGGTDDAFLIVKVSPDAPSQPPVAFDQNVDAKSAVGKHTVKVNVLHDAQNPGGLVSELKVAAVGPNKAAARVDDTGTITITLTDSSQAVAYTLTNTIDRLSATAFITVPRYTDSQPPFLSKSVKLPQNVGMNGSITWKLSDIITVPSGRPARVAEPKTATAGRSNGDPIVVDDHTIRYSPEKNFRGNTVVTFKVTDGDSADDPNAATIQIPIVVGDPSYRDIAPSFSNQTVQIQPGEAPTTFDLRGASSHPNPDVVKELAYQDFTGGTGVVKAGLSGSIVTMSTSVDTAVGTTAVLKFNVVEGSFTVPGQITVKVAKSTRPLPQAVDDSEPDGRSSSTYTISPLQNDFNPFADQGKALKITDVRFQGDPLGASETFTGSAVTVHTGTAKAGTVSLVYTIRDATNSADRQVQGLITVVVRSAPEPVTDIRLSNPGSGLVDVIFQPPVSSNGASITGYSVTITGGPSGATRTDCQAGATCEFSGRTNASTQTVSVAVSNQVGTTPSSASKSITPYGKPATPTQALLSYDNSASSGPRLTWNIQTSDTGGGDVRCYGEWYRDSVAIGAFPGSCSGSGEQAGSGTYYYVIQVCNAGSKGDYTNCSDPVTSNTAFLRPTVKVQKGSAQTNGTSCTTTPCAQVQVDGDGFRANATVTIHYYTDCGSYQGKDGCFYDGGSYASENVATASDGTFDVRDKLLGYPGANVWVVVTDADGQNYESAHIPW